MFEFAPRLRGWKGPDQFERGWYIILGLTFKTWRDGEHHDGTYCTYRVLEKHANSTCLSCTSAVAKCLTWWKGISLSQWSLAALRLCVCSENKAFQSKIQHSNRLSAKHPYSVTVLNKVTGWLSKRYRISIPIVSSRIWRLWLSPWRPFAWTADAPSAIRPPRSKKW